VIVSLTGPSRTIIVEPVQEPEAKPEPVAPAEPAEPAPADPAPA
jgi:hypothetical protein